MADFTAEHSQFKLERDGSIYYPKLILGCTPLDEDNGDAHLSWVDPGTSEPATQDGRCEIVWPFGPDEIATRAELEAGDVVGRVAEIIPG